MTLMDGIASPSRRNIDIIAGYHCSEPANQSAVWTAPSLFVIDFILLHLIFIRRSPSPANMEATQCSRQILTQWTRTRQRQTEDMHAKQKVECYGNGNGNGNGRRHGNWNGAFISISIDQYHLTLLPRLRDDTAKTNKRTWHIDQMYCLLSDYYTLLQLTNSRER